ncbi:MAG: hypothetical protein ABIH78_04030 [Candidatus Peregrinibacteria bacterium]
MVRRLEREAFEYDDEEEDDDTFENPVNLLAAAKILGLHIDCWNNNGRKDMVQRKIDETVLAVTSSGISCLRIFLDTQRAALVRAVGDRRTVNAAIKKVRACDNSNIDALVQKCRRQAGSCLDQEDENSGR